MKTLFFKIRSPTEKHLSHRLNIPITSKSVKIHNTIFKSEYRLKSNLEFILRFKDKYEYFTQYTLYLLFKRLSFAVNSKLNDDVELIYSDKHDYQIEIGPLNITKKVKHNSDLYIHYKRNSSGHYKLVFFGKDQQFNTFLQKVFLYCFSVLRKVEPLPENNPTCEVIEKLHNKFYSQFKSPFNKTNKFVPIFDYILPKFEEKNYADILMHVNADNIIVANCGTGELCYYLIKQDKKRNILGIDRTDIIKAARRNKNVTANAFYRGLTFLQVHELYPVIENYQPVDLFIIENEPEDVDLLINRLQDFYRPQRIISRFELPLACMFKGKNLYVYVLPINYNLSAWQQKYESYIGNSWYKYRLINEGYCILNSNDTLENAYKTGLAHAKNINSIA